MSDTRKAFDGDAAVKQAIITRLKTHWATGKVTPQFKMVYKAPPHDETGVMGATVESEDESEYERQLGIPAEAAYLHETLLYFCGRETMPDDPEGAPIFTLAPFAQDYPVQWLNAIAPGANLSMLAPRFVAWTLRDLLSGGLPSQLALDPAIKAAGEGVQVLFDTAIAGGTVPPEQWTAARKAAVRATDGTADALSHTIGGFVEAAAWPLHSSVGELRGNVADLWMSLANLLQRTHMTAEELARDDVLRNARMERMEAAQSPDYDPDAYLAARPALKAAVEHFMSAEGRARRDALKLESLSTIHALARRHFEALLQLTCTA